MAYTTIDKPSDYFNTILNSGDNTSPKSISGFGFRPDWVWTKCRTAAYDHSISDSVRGANKTIRSNNTSAEVSDDIYGNLTAFNSDGFTATAGSNSINYYNQSGQTYVNWGWLASNTTASNTDGSITSSVSANTTAGFSIVSYTGTGSNATVGHGLGVAPKMIITKVRSASGNNWSTYHSSLGAGNVIWLNLNNASSSDSTFWNNTTPTSSVFSIGTQGDTNRSSETIIAYCFAEKKGYSKFGSYAGNSSTDGTFIYTGFKPALVIFKSTAGTESWSMVDNKRDTFNVVKKQLFPNLSNAAETTNNVMDFCSNGFKMRNSDTRYNYSSYTYIYMAFAENPFVTSTGIPACAR